ncbi:MAG TPA: hypothetical protein VGC92_16775, partial [Phenylobacterium sp.]
MKHSDSALRAAILCLGVSSLLVAGCTGKGQDKAKSQNALSATAPQAFTAPVEPGGDQASADFAQAHPDDYAWKLFSFVCLQAAPGKAGVPA